MSAATLKRVRKICLELPEAVEKEAWGGPTFRVKKMFAMYVDDHHGDGRNALWIKSTADDQDVLVDSDSERFFVPPYVGKNGWVGVRLEKDRVDWEEVAELVEDGYRLIAPRRLVERLDEE
ncbi:MAG: MmcQ/YjbR family DNA-binding protein [Deltaproteobacteria bacterium]|nr:MmcQ/YjbR family DNA-binding protein [Deltaproteobacteria bacterium]MBW2415815.1 MmcQ/YjbR family DNA-binding protein [Deltaproteobacteria bacterium]